MSTKPKPKPAAPAVFLVLIGLPVIGVGLLCCFLWVLLEIGWYKARELADGWLRLR